MLFVVSLWCSRINQHFPVLMNRTVHFLVAFLKSSFKMKSDLFVHESCWLKPLNLTLYLQCARLWNRVGFRPHTKAKRAWYLKTTSLTSDGTSRMSLTHTDRAQIFRFINKDGLHSLIVTLLTDYWGGIWIIDLLYEILSEEMTNPTEKWVILYLMTDLIFRVLIILFYVFSGFKM